MIYLKLFYEFFKVGLFAIGGGLTTIPFLNQLGAKTGWFTTTDLTNMIAISESTPGPTGINMATYVGYVSCGVPGAIIATLGIVTPSIIIIVLISKAIYAYKDSKLVNDAMKGIRACSIGLITYAVINVVFSNILYINKFIETKNINDLFDIKVLFIFGLILICVKKIKSHPIAWIALSAILGIVLF